MFFKIKKIILLVILAIIIKLSVTNVFGFNYVICPPDCSGRIWNNQSYPDLYGSYKDAYGLTIRRMTEEGSRPQYPNGIVSVENSDGTLLVATKESTPNSSGWAIYTTADGKYRCSLPNFGEQGYVGGSKGWWSATEPNVFYWIHGSNSRLYKATINTQNWTITNQMLYDFKSYPPFSDAWKIVVSDEHNPSWDMRYWALMVKYPEDNTENSATYIALFDKDYSGIDVPNGGKILGYYKLPSSHACFAAGISPGGNYIFYRCGIGECGLPGQCDIAWSVKDFPNNPFVLANRISPHFTMGYDTSGNEVMVHMYSGDGNMYMWRFNNPGNANMIKIANVTDLRPGTSTGAGDTHFITVGRGLGARSWVAWVPTDSDPDDECGQEENLRATITFIRLSKDNLLWRVAHTRSDATGYSSQCFGGGDFDGQYFYFSSNWCGNQKQQVFRVELPDNWWNEIGRLGIQDILPSPPFIKYVK